MPRLNKRIMYDKDWRRSNKCHHTTYAAGESHRHQQTPDTHVGGGGHTHHDGHKQRYRPRIAQH